ncbi:acyl-CoA dehydrogenase family protein [Nocardioides acrostichi]|uniref:Acyl-CoA dehydrogenase family protein n=1 Tax=Nocardioides acrostichi TaxID=2784339 RepID=A0A930Y857_9ACTN|nr:acyl-CoA dehydrogenase family protein [Nocardioides acrostichi]MBF4162711.1 acyl-CoA dehydrogenase family protein [Nocardioides acrostichi]
MTYSAQLSKPLVDYARTLREWSTSEARPYARAADTDHRPPANWADVLDTCPVPLGRVDLPEPQALPDFEEGYWVRALVFYESLNYGDIWVHPTLGGGIGHLVVESMGTPEQLEKWYEPVLERGFTTGFALTEPGFGSDTSQVSTTATRDGDNWVINGTKIYCSGGATAEYVVVFATVDKSLGAKGINAFVVPKDAPGFVVAKENEQKLGIRSWVTSELVFDHCVIPVENQLGWTPDGAATPRRSGQGGALGALAHNRPNMSAMCIGLGQASIDVTAGILAGQKAGFTPQRWQAVESELERMNAALERGRRMTFRAQYLVDQGKEDRAVSAAGKGYAPQTVERVIRRCMQLLGPEGTSQDLLLEKWYRDVKIMDIFEGSGQVQRIVVGRTLMGRLVG